MATSLKKLKTYTPQQVADATGFSMPTVYRMLKTGKLKSLQSAGDRRHVYRIPEEEIRKHWPEILEV